MKQRTTVCMACTVAAMAACPTYAQQVVAPESAASAPAAQSVTVTGTKRKQLEQEATQSLNVLKPNDLINERDAYDALLRLPNVSIGARSSLPKVRGVNNATDRTYYTERSVGAFGDIAQLAPPRTAGVTATYRF
jgi:outer membrane receptor protein involved in Fe transport